jgi:hypothetical protein
LYNEAITIAGGFWMDILQGHFHQWGAVLFFVLLYGAALFFVPFYKKMDRKPATAYLAFALAFAIEMHGIHQPHRQR